MFETVGVKSSLRYISAAVAAWYFYKHFIKPFLSPLRKIPGCPYRPVIGNLLETMREEANNNGIRWMEKYKSNIIRFYFFGGEGAVLVGDPAIAKHMLISNSKNYHRSSTSTGLLNTVTPGFLALTSGEEHHALRRLVNPVFSSHAIEDYIPSFEKFGRKLIRKWSETAEGKDDKTVVEAQDYMTRLTLDAICHCGFDYDMNSLDNGDHSPEVKAFKAILGGLELGLLQLLNLTWFPTKKNRQIWSDINKYRSTITEVINLKKEKLHEVHLGYSEKSGIDGNYSLYPRSRCIGGGTFGKNKRGCPKSKDILSQLLQAKDENGQTLTNKSLYSQVGGFLFAGFETTSTSLTWSLLELASRPEVQDKARQEVTEVLPDKSQPITAKQVEALTYLTCVIKESLRYNPPISTVFRRALTGDYLNGYYIPKGTLVGINLGALHKLPKNWPEPLEFKPERFMTDYDKYAFLPFGAGPYMCIGSQFSLVETKMTLALILRHFKISLPEGYQYRRIRKLTVQPSPPLRLVIEPLTEL